MKRGILEYGFVLFVADFDYGSAYIGGTLMEGDWVWNWDVNNPIDFFDWGNTTTNQPDGDGECIRLSEAADYKWADGDCNSEKRYICEIYL